MNILSLSLSLSGVFMCGHLMFLTLVFCSILHNGHQNYMMRLFYHMRRMRSRQGNHSLTQYSQTLCFSLIHSHTHSLNHTCPFNNQGMLEQVIHPYVVRSINLQSLSKFMDTVEKFLADEGVNQSIVGKVLWNL